MAIPLLIPILMGVGVSVAVGSAKKRRKLAKPQYDWVSDNLAIALNPAAVLQAEKWIEPPLVSVLVGPAATADQIEGAFSEEVGEVADEFQDLKFLFASEWKTVKPAALRASSNGKIDQTVAWAITGVRAWSDVSAATFKAETSLDEFSAALRNIIYWTQGVS